MGVKTGIPWCHHTFNMVWGCTKVDRGCANCYAEAWATRWGFNVWGPKTKYREFDDRHWNEPKRWNHDASAVRERRRVFGGSMCDPFDRDIPLHIRIRFWELIRVCTNLDWLLLTKRPENIAEMLPADWEHGWSNVWILASAHDQKSLAERTRIIDEVPAIVKGISLEPLVGDDVDLRPLNLSGAFPPWNWLIVGGESGPGAARYPLVAATRVIDQAKRLKIPVFHKQFGSVLAKEYGWKDAKGENMAEWPEKYRRREFPLEGVRRCYICGCHDLHACPGGCSWSPIDDVCSSCF